MHRALQFCPRYTEEVKTIENRGTWLAHPEERATLNLSVMSSRLTLGVEITSTNKQTLKKKLKTHAHIKPLMFLTAKSGNHSNASQFMNRKTKVVCVREYYLSIK